MPLTVITLKNSPPSLRGDLTKWMQEISTGVYVGNFNTKIREELWKRVVESVGIGEATISYAYRNEIGYNFKIHNSNKVSIDFDGIPLVLIPINEKIENSKQKRGFSKASKYRKAKKYTAKERINSNEIYKSYIVLDLETTGLDYQKDSIIEIGAIKITDKTEEYNCLVKYEHNLSETVKTLTNINENDLKNAKDEMKAIEELVEFIGDSVIIGYNVNFDIKFINESLKRHSRSQIKNKIYDVMKYVKQDKMFLKNYKLETVIKEYDIECEVPHRALEDAKIIKKLANELPELMEKLR